MFPPQVYVHSSPLALAAGSAEALPTASELDVEGCASLVGCTFGCVTNRANRKLDLGIGTTHDDRCIWRSA